jgi:hypothetical protein
MDAMAWTAWMVALALLERTARAERLAPREPTAHPELLVLLAWMVAMGPQERVVLLVPLGLLAHRGRREPRGRTGPTDVTVSMDPQESAGPQPPSDRRP